MKKYSCVKQLAGVYQTWQNDPYMVLFLAVLMLYVTIPATIFQSCQDDFQSSWVEPVF